MAYVIGKNRAYLIAHDDQELTWVQKWMYFRFLAKRKKGIPVAYLLKVKEFYGMDFHVTPDVLVPRPDTEILVDGLVKYLSENFRKMNEVMLLDIGTGSGCIPISTLVNVEDLHAVATDISTNALKIARMNAREHRVRDRIVFLKSDLLEGVSSGLFEGKELVVTANLPYVPTDFDVNIETKFEPQIALYGGKDGMDIYEKLAHQLEAIKPRAIFFEMFDFQIAILAEKMPDYELKHVKNMTGMAKVLMMERISG